MRTGVGGANQRLPADGKANRKLLCNMDSVDMRAPEDQAEWTDHEASSSSVQQLNTQEELIQAQDQSSLSERKSVRS